MHTFQTFWWGESLSPYESFCLKSFIDHGHKVDLYSFESSLAVPAGVIVCDASALIGRDNFFTYQNGAGKGSPAAFANLFRYLLLAEKGGWWIDTDVVCLSSQIADFPEFFAWQDPDYINNAVLCFEAQHPAMKRCHSVAQELGSSVRWGQTGPELLTNVLTELGILGRAQPASCCYPVSHAQALDLLRPSRTAAILEGMSQALFLHLWNELFRRIGIQKHCRPPADSVLRKLADRHVVTGWTSEYDVETVEQLIALKAELDALAVANQKLRIDVAHNESEKNRLHVVLQNMTQEVAQLRAEVDRQQSVISAMIVSASWRVTAPMRAAVRKFRSRIRSG